MAIEESKSLDSNSRSSQLLLLLLPAEVGDKAVGLSWPGGPEAAIWSTQGLRSSAATITLGKATREDRVGTALGGQCKITTTDHSIF